MDFLVQFLGGLSLMLFCALIFGEVISGSALMERSAAQTGAVLLIMLFGTAAGLIALAAITYYGATPAGLFGNSGLVIQVLGVCAAILMLGGAFIARGNLYTAGLLLGAGGFALLFTYGFTWATGVAMALAAIAASSALVMVQDGHVPSRRHV